MDVLSCTIDDVLAIETIVLVAMFVATVMASTGIYQLTKNRRKREAHGASERKQGLSNGIRGRMIEFYVPDNFRANQRGDARLRSHLPASQREQRG